MKKPKISPRGYSSSVGKAYVRRTYNSFAKKYFPADVLPEFDSLDFEFAEHPGEHGSITYDENGLVNLSLRPVLRKYKTWLRSTLLHEMIHLKLDSKYGHGKTFYKEAMRVAALGGIRIWC